ncbi:MAG: endonuclease domain-containing protein [Gammaproteobacteria bacterium]
MAPLTRLSSATQQNSRCLRREMTDAERRLWQPLRERQIGEYKFRRQHPIGRYVLNIVGPEARWVIEVDGGQHGERGLWTLNPHPRLPPARGNGQK